jgi:hypothetical protein
LKPQYVELIPNFAFNFNLRHFSLVKFDGAALAEHCGPDGRGNAPLTVDFSSVRF